MAIESIQLKNALTIIIQGILFAFCIESMDMSNEHEFKTFYRINKNENVIS